jgi:long-chain acyl-CoA synthetase
MTSRTVYTVLEETARRWGDKPALHQPNGTGGYRAWTWDDYSRVAREIACGLRRLGIGKDDKVALFAETRAEFYLADMGIMTAGAVSAALYTSYPLPDQIRNLRHSDARMIFAEDATAMRALEGAAGPEGLNVRWVLMTGAADPGQEAITLDELCDIGRRAMAEDPGLFERIREETRPEDPAILYLTSGATGEPKMGLVSHGALVSNIDMGPVVLPLTPDDCAIAFLPSAHIAQRVGVELVPIGVGCSVWFSEGLSKMPSEFRRIRPTFFLAPPRVWERVYASVSNEIRKRGALARRMFYFSLGLGLEAGRLRQQGKPVPAWMGRALKIANRLVFSKIRERLGGRVRLAASGAAPLGRELAEFYSAIGMPLIEGYGLTEGGVVSFNPPDRPKPGSIGPALPGVELRLADDGELLVKSPCLFLGYYKDPVSTAAVLRDGWLHTGDIAEIDSEGYVYITGRKKELIVSSNGKKIYPSRIEMLFKSEPVINQVVLIGDRLPYVTALVTINAANAESLAGMSEYKGRDMAAIAAAPPVRQAVQKAVAKANRQLAEFERVRKFRVLERDFSIEAGELTPTMKVRRNRVLENYRSTVSELYMGREESQ